MRCTVNVVDWMGKWVKAIHDRLTPQRFYPMFLGVLTLAGLAGLLLPGMPGGHDLYYHLTRLHAMAVNFRLGEIPSMVNHEALCGYGYATGLFYPDLFLYPAVLLMLCGVGIVAAYKLLVVGWMLFTAWSAWHCAKKLSATSFGAFAVALLYTWSSYLATDLFLRESLGEFFAFAFAPWILLGLYELIYGEPRKFYYFSFGFLGLVCSHSLSLLLWTAVCATILFFNALRLLREPRRLGYLLLSPVPVVLLGIAFLAPMCEQFAHLDFIIQGEENEAILERCMPFLKLFLEIPTSKPPVWIPPGIGLIFVITGLQRLRLASRRTAVELFRDLCLIAGVACLLMATEMPSWKGAFKPLAVIQFPWRFFGPATAFLAFGGGLTLASLVGSEWRRERYWLWIVVAGAGFAWFVNVGYCYASRIHEHDLVKSYHPGRPQEASGIHYLPAGGLLDTEIRERGDVVVPSHPLDWQVSRPQKNVLEVSFAGNSQENEIEVPIVPYYGYQAWLDLPDGGKRRLATGVGTNRLLTVVIPADCPSGRVTVGYRTTPLQRGSWLCSLVSACALLGGWLWRRRKIRRSVSGA